MQDNGGLRNGPRAHFFFVDFGDFERRLMLLRTAAWMGAPFFAIKEDRINKRK
jgi:hypothetical protein